MKWIILIFCLFQASFAEPESLTERRQKLLEGLCSVGCRIQFPTHLAEVLIAQNLQRVTYEEVAKMANNFTELAMKCLSDEQSKPECAKPLDILCYDQFCNEHGLVEKYGFTDCCGKVDEERKECFLSHKNATPEYIPPFEEPTPEERCKAFQEDFITAMGGYLYEIARRNPFTSVFIPFNIVHDLKEVLTTCCQEGNQSACLDEKIPNIRKKLLTALHLEKHSCSILKTFKKRTIKAIKFVQLSQKFPKADVLTIDKLAGDITHSQERCCKGDTLECFIERVKVIDYTCGNRDALSSKLKGCCEKPFIKQNECLVTVENDDRPADLSPTLKEFMDNEQLCPRYAEDQNPLLAEFVYEYARRHPEFSVQMILRLGEDFEEQLEKCCKTENPKECLSQEEEQLKGHIAGTLKVIKKNCDLFEQMGASLFHNELLVRYTKKAPQLSFEELREYTKAFIDGAAKCCKKDEAHRLLCVDREADLVIGDICQRHEEHPINKQVGRCCDDSYVNRRECFLGLGVDEEYAPFSIDPELFAFRGDFCLAKSEDQQIKKQRLLVNLVKHKPTITEEQLAGVVKDFSDIMTKCCVADNHKECFTAEGPKLIERTRASLGES